MYTLSYFIDEQLTNFNIQDTEENKKKLRIKFTRELKKLGYWDNAETKLVEKSITKVFSASQLANLYKNVEKYLIKASGLSVEEIQQKQQENLQGLENWRNTDWNAFYSEIETEINYGAPLVSEDEKIKLMIKALFNMHFELNEKLWQDDVDYLHIADTQDEDVITSTKYILANERQKDKLKGYVKKRKED